MYFFSLIFTAFAEETKAAALRSRASLDKFHNPSY
jgi:hypothetical protein